GLRRVLTLTRMRRGTGLLRRHGRAADGSTLGGHRAGLSGQRSALNGHRPRRRRHPPALRRP
ncbi:hypothetical protein, partial [Nocardia xishanensis]|uniref:hypothetical protein n=1 Tax=Nocardia xishanensis TaxID=238964 RepID=UPI001C3FDC90